MLRGVVALALCVCVCVFKFNNSPCYHVLMLNLDFLLLPSLSLLQILPSSASFTKFSDQNT